MTRLRHVAHSSWIGFKTPSCRCRHQNLRHHRKLRFQYRRRRHHRCLRRLRHRHQQRRLRHLRQIPAKERKKKGNA